MARSPGFRFPVRALPALLLALATSGCIYGRYEGDVERNPTVDTGAGASIILPGESMPAYSASPQAAPGGSPEGSPAQPASSLPSAGPVTMIGGSEIDQEKHVQAKEDPLIWKWATTPFAILAAPFVAAAEAARGEPEPAPPVPEQKPERRAAERRPPPVDYETRQIQEMERELDRMGAQAPPPAPIADSRTQSSGGLSIADELAELQRAPTAPRQPQQPVVQPAETRAVPGAEPLRLEGQAPVADGIVDRDEDGRIDLWIYREEGQIVRKALDQDYDGKPDTTLHYDPRTHKLARVEEDSDHDGATDTWTEYRDGVVVRRRSDADRDGGIDTWSYFRAGELERHEQDTSGDGFRDRTGYYEDGRLVREVHDRDGDGRADVTNHYDVRERIVRREEDTDMDGDVDVVSHYEEGRLARRELLDADVTATP